MIGRAIDCTERLAAVGILVVVTVGFWVLVLTTKVEDRHEDANR